MKLPASVRTADDLRLSRQAEKPRFIPKKYYHNIDTWCSESHLSTTTDNKLVACTKLQLVLEPTYDSRNAKCGLAAKEAAAAEAERLLDDCEAMYVGPHRKSLTIM